MTEEEQAKRQAQANCCNAQSPQPLKDFDSCGIEEKTQRLYLIVKELRQSLQYVYQLNAQLSNKVYQLEHHQHSANGDCLVKIDDGNRQYPGSGLVGAQMSHDLLA